MAKVNYDGKEDILSLSKGKKVRSSIDIGDFIIDIDSEGFVVGLEILDASENLHVSKAELVSLEKASMVVTYKPSAAYVHLVLCFSGREKDITIPLVLDLGHSKVSTEKTEFALA